MTASLIPAAAAMARFFPDTTDLYDCFFAIVQDDELAKVLLVEGDLAIDTEGTVQTERLVPELIEGMGEKDHLVGVIVTGDLKAPKATLLEPDIDWSPRIKVLGSLHVRSLCLGGSVFEVAGDLTAESTVFGFYNHGILRVGGRTRAAVILTSDYTIEFSGEVVCPRVLANVPRLNIPTHFADDGLAEVLDPDLIDSSNNPKEAEIIQRLGAGGSLLRPKEEIGKPRRRIVSKVGREKLDAIAARAAAGETIVEIDLTESDLRFVPEEIRRYAALRVLRLSKNKVRELPDWIGAFPLLEVLSLESCGPTSLPPSIASHGRLKELDLNYNEIEDLVLVDDAFPALEKLSIGRGWGDAHADFVMNLDLGAFPRLRLVEQSFSNLPHISYGRVARLWNAPSLEYYDFGGIFDERTPEGLLELRGLRGLSCAIAASAFKSALTVLPRLPALEVLTLDFGSELDPKRLAAIQAALPGVYVRVSQLGAFDEKDRDDRHAMARRVSDLLQREQFAEAVAMSEQLFERFDLMRPDVSAGWLESAMRERCWALMADAVDEPDPALRRAKMERSVAWADRLLARLPKTPDIAWWTNFDLGLLRFECLLAKVDALADRGGKADTEAAKSLLETAASEVERHVARFAWRLPECRERIARRRARLPE